jgi:hypothetical protein
MAERDDERALRGLTASSPSVVGVEGAMRARDVARPRPADHAAAASLPLKQGPRVADAPKSARPATPPAGPAGRPSARNG